MKDDRNTSIYVAFEDHEAHDTAGPERGLLRAILLTALADLRKEGEVGRRAAEYFLSPEDDYLFSFRSVCSFLEVDPDQILIVAGLKVKRDGRRKKVASVSGSRAA